jgi:hypothetical protein
LASGGKILAIEKLKINNLLTKSIFPIKKMWIRLDVPKCLLLGEHQYWIAPCPLKLAAFWVSF